MKNIKSRLSRKYHIRKKIFGTEERPRMSVFKSNKRLYVQLINDDKQVTLCSASSLEKDLKTAKLNIETAKKVGKLIADRAKENNIKNAVFDRNGFLYHGRVKALAESARENGLEF